MPHGCACLEMHGKRLDKLLSHCNFKGPLDAGFYFLRPVSGLNYFINLLPNVNEA